MEPSQLWIVVTGFVTAFVLAFGIGANDVANSFGTSVGAKVLTLRQACILATIFEISGSLLLGAKVSETIRQGIIDPALYQEGNDQDTELLLLGLVAALGGSCVWLLVATFARVPVSGTHSIVGATVGFSLVAKGFRGVNWLTLGHIVISWFASPVMSALVSVLLFFLVQRCIINKTNPLERGLLALPLIYGVTVATNLFSIFHDGPTLLLFHLIPLWGAFVASFGLGLLTSVVVKFFVVPSLRRRILRKSGVADDRDLIASASSTDSANSQQPSVDSSTTDGNNNHQFDSPKTRKFIVDEVEAGNPLMLNESVSTDSCSVTGAKIDEETETETETGGKTKTRKEVVDSPECTQLFSFLQILTAIFGAFAHGGNDVSNAIGPLIGIWLIATAGGTGGGETPWWILMYGGVGISLGLWIWGRRVIRTLGEDLTKVTPSSGFCIELGAALTVLVASNARLPVSTTHCKVGSVVGVGWYRSRDNVDWRVFLNIILAWFVTVPASAALGAGIMFGLMQIAASTGNPALATNSTNWNISTTTILFNTSELAFALQ